MCASQASWPWEVPLEITRAVQRQEAQCSFQKELLLYNKTERDKEREREGGRD